MARYAVVNTDLMSATDVRSGMRSFRYGTIDTDGTFTGKEIENASVVTLDSLFEGNNDLWKAVDMKATTPLEELVLVTTPEMIYDERLKRDIFAFINEADTNCTGMLLHKGDIFSATEEAFDGTPEVGKTVNAQAGSKMKVSGTGTLIGTITDIRIHNRVPYYGVLVG